jgi:hypothetical protein
MARERDTDEYETRPGEQTNEEKRRPRPDDDCACGSHRLASGRCEATGLWPRYVWRREGRERFTLAVKCPFACPVCSQPLEWHGGCYQCHGSPTPWDRDTWTFPGDRYERREDGHWERIDGPHPACTPAQNKVAAELVKRVLAGELTAEKALEELPFRPVVDP